MSSAAKGLVAFLVLGLTACATETAPEESQGSWVILDAPLPPERHTPAVVEAEWNAGDDPLNVENIDVMDPDRQRYVEELKQTLTNFDDEFYAECFRLLELKRAGRMLEFQAGLEELPREVMPNEQLKRRVSDIREEGVELSMTGETGARISLLLPWPDEFQTSHLPD